jgi:hypothetical protein
MRYMSHPIAHQKVTFYRLFVALSSVNLLPSAKYAGKAVR